MLWEKEAAAGGLTDEGENALRAFLADLPPRTARTYCEVTGFDYDKLTLLNGGNHEEKEAG